MNIERQIDNIMQQVPNTMSGSYNPACYNYINQDK